MNDSGRKLTSSSLTIFFLPLLLFTRCVGGNGADANVRLKHHWVAITVQSGVGGGGHKISGRLLSAGKHPHGYILLGRHENWDNTGLGRREVGKQRCEQKNVDRLKLL